MKAFLSIFVVSALLISCHAGDPHLGMRAGVGGELLNAAREGNLDKIKKALKENADIEIRDDNDETEYDDTGYTPLHHACEQGHKEVAQLLIEEGADVNKPTFRRGRTPLHYACMEGHLAIVKLLKKHGADMEQTDNRGGTPMHYAAAAGCLDIIKYFRGLSIDINQAAGDASIPLHAASGQGRLTVVEYLYSLGGDLEQQTRSGMTPLHYAVLRNQKEVATFLTSVANVDSFIDFQADEGSTALHFAASLGYQELVEVLLAAGADATITNKKGATPLARAQQKKHDAIVTLLKEAMSQKKDRYKQGNSLCAA